MKVLSCAPPNRKYREETVVELIIRDHNKIKFENEKRVEKIVRKINKKFAETIW
jgi:hypothetical protein